MPREKKERKEIKVKGVEEIGLKTVKKIANDKMKQSVSLSLDLTCSQAEELKEMMEGTKLWYVVIGVEAKQPTMIPTEEPPTAT